MLIKIQNPSQLFVDLEADRGFWPHPPLLCVSSGFRLPLYEPPMSHKQVESEEDQHKPLSHFIAFLLQRGTGASVSSWENPLQILPLPGRYYKTLV